MQQQVFDEEDFQPQRSRDTELTLGRWVVAGLVFGLVLLCALCFEVGYHVGRTSAQKATTASDSSAPVPAVNTPSWTNAKPTAKPAAKTQDEPIYPGEMLESRPAAAASVTPAPSAPPASSATPEKAPPATSSAGPSVQIAAVSNQEDADVLVSALRRRGYAVHINRDPGDELLHVRIGPFNSTLEANKWRQKLLEDGYNAILQP